MSNIVHKLKNILMHPLLILILKLRMTQQLFTIYFFLSFFLKKKDIKIVQIVMCVSVEYIYFNTLESASHVLFTLCALSTHNDHHTYNHTPI